MIKRSTLYKTCNQPTSTCLPPVNPAKSPAKTVLAKITALAKTRAATTALLKEAAAKMDRDEHQSNSRRTQVEAVEHSLKIFFPVSFSVVFLITIILFYCLI